jgi:type IV secretory pathway VirB2 component (pilin)
MFNFFKPLERCFADKVNGGCSWIHIEPFVQGILKNLLLIGMFVAVCMVSYVGFILLKGFGDPSARSKAKHILMSVVVGLIILFGAYFIVDLVLDQILPANSIIRQNGI